MKIKTGTPRLEGVYYVVFDSAYKQLLYKGKFEKIYTGSKNSAEKTGCPEDCRRKYVDITV